MTSRRLERRKIMIDGVALSYLESGDADSSRASMLLLHGLTASAESFEPLIACLPASMHLVALDLPGNGESGRGPHLDVSFRGQARLVQRFVEAFPLVEPVLVGHSHGGALALKVAAMAAKDVRALILLCPAHPFSGHERGLVQFYLSTPGRFFAYLVPLLPGRVQQIGFRHMMGPNSQVATARFAPYRRNLRRRGAVSHLLRLLKSWQEDMDALREELRRNPLRLPALMIWGALDPVVPAKTAQALKEHLGEVEMVLLEGVGHLPNEEAPTECAQIMVRWLGGLRGSPKPEGSS